MYSTLVNKILFLKLILLLNSLFLEVVLLFNSTPARRTEKLRPLESFVLVSCPCVLVDFWICAYMYKGIIRREFGILQKNRKF